MGPVAAIPKKQALAILHAKQLELSPAARLLPDLHRPAVPTFREWATEYALWHEVEYPHSSAMARQMKIVVWQGHSDWRWHLDAANGKTIAQGEGHPTKRNAIRAATGIVRSIFASFVYMPKKPPVKFESYEGNDQTYITWA